VNPSSFRALQELAYRQAGISFLDRKQALVSARLARRVRALNLDSEEAYVDYLHSDPSGTELLQFLDAMTTNFTSFFRESSHFEDLRAEVSELASQGQRRFRIWSAACSTGEEPYSMAMVLSDTLGPRIDWRILATDLSTRVLGQAMEGVYPAKVVEAIPSDVSGRHLVRETASAQGGFRVRPELRERISFRRLNLSIPPFPMSGPLDAVFCRNVMIYFDPPVRQRLVTEIERLLRPGGLLCVGHTETLNGLKTRLRMLKPSVYRREEAGS
jgi:chemotaxis protein methyltransferase CheR